MLVEPDYRLPMLNTVKVPSGVNEAAVRNHLLQEHEIEIGPGLGPLTGSVWRIGLMGHSARPENVSRMLSALADTLNDRRVRAAHPLPNHLPLSVASEPCSRLAEPEPVQHSQVKGI